MALSEMTDPAAVERARAGLPPSYLIAEASKLLKAVADPTRMRLLSALRAAGELCVGDLAAAVAMSESAVSHQLRLLRRLKLVTPRKASRQVFYRLSDEHVATILDFALEHAGE
ncbi:MAG: metalloregulator ArsR/SmtB family transcription factor [Thermaceae bacterium]|nr:metalloregulator ArsR/SmtB family transcription factor [Thermaceae bacterium]